MLGVILLVRLKVWVGSVVFISRFNDKRRIYKIERLVGRRRNEIGWD